MAKKVKQQSAPRAIALATVEISDDGAKGRYKVGQAVDGAAAVLLLERYPVYFVEATDPQPAISKE